MRFNIRAIPMREFVLIEARYLAEAFAIFAIIFGYDDNTVVQYKQAGRGDRRRALTMFNVLIKRNRLLVKQQPTRH